MPARRRHARRAQSARDTVSVGVNAVKSWRSHERLRARVQRRHGRAGMASAGPAAAERRPARSREHAVAVRARGRVVSRVERRRRPRSSEHRDVVRQQRVERPRGRDLALVARDLPERVDAGVGAPGDGQRRPRRGGAGRRERRARARLHGARRPAERAQPAEVRSVVLDQQPTPSRTATRGIRPPPCGGGPFRPVRAGPSRSRRTGAARA